MKKLSPLKLSIIPLLMFGFGFALVPLYDIFCHYQVADEASLKLESSQGEKIIPLRLLADADSRDVWNFTPPVLPRENGPNIWLRLNVFVLTNKKFHRTQR